MTYLLLMNCAPIDAITARGLTALHVATLSNSVGSMRELLSRGANANTRDAVVGHTPLIDAIRLGHRRATRMLLAAPGIDPNAPAMVPTLERSALSQSQHQQQQQVQQSRATMPLRFAVLSGNSRAVLRLMVHPGMASVNHRDPESGETALHVAVRLGYGRIVRRLLRGAAQNSPISNLIAVASADSAAVAATAAAAGDAAPASQRSSVVSLDQVVRGVSGLSAADDECAHDSDRRRRSSALSASDGNDSATAPAAAASASRAPPSRFADVTIKDSTSLTPIALARSLGFDRMARFMSKFEPPPAADDDDDAAAADRDRALKKSESQLEREMSDGAFVELWKKREAAARRRQDEFLRRQAVIEQLTNCASGASFGDGDGQVGGGGGAAASREGSAVWVDAGDAASDAGSARSPAPFALNVQDAIARVVAESAAREAAEAAQRQRDEEEEEEAPSESDGDAGGDDGSGVAPNPDAIAATAMAAPRVGTSTIARVAR